jgi:hypothetical protein
MSLFSEILNVHYEWLQQKGYDRHTLALSRLQEDPSFLLRNAFETVIRETLWSNQSHEFSISIPGHFGRHNQETVDFTFGYRYDPKRIRLDLQTLRVLMKDQVNTWLINSKPYLLPHSSAAFEQLYQKLLNASDRQELTPTIGNSRQASKPKR